MARGIIATKPGGASGSGNGKILVTDGTDTSGLTSGVISSVPISGVVTGSLSASAILDPGSVLGFSDIGSSSVGDVVDFVIGADGLATKITTYKPGKVITGNYTDNIVANAGEAYLINGAANFDGKITINEGYVAIVDNSHIEGKIESSTAGSFLLADGVVIEGKVEITGAGTMSIKNSTVEGKISSTGNTFASVQGCQIKGKLEILNAKVCKTSGNTVEGKTNTPGCTA